MPRRVKTTKQVDLPLTEGEAFSNHLRGLRLKRRALKKKLRAAKRRRQSLSARVRLKILEKTGSRCHICGGEIFDDWQADHVLAHSGGGLHAVDNYLPAHALCNNYRWDYTAEEFQCVLKLGVWIRRQIEDKTPLGIEASKRYVKHEVTRERRRTTPGKVS
jgi:hypothetical protein